MVKVFVKTFLSNVEEKPETVGQGSKRLELELKYHPMLFRTTYMKGIPHKVGTVVNVHCMFRSHAGHRSVLYLDTFYGVWLWASKLELLVFHLSPRQDRTFLFSWKKKQSTCGSLNLYCTLLHLLDFCTLSQCTFAFCVSFYSQDSLHRSNKDYAGCIFKVKKWLLVVKRHAGVTI